ncbi:MAG: PAS domain S-box protein [Acidobacteria bacterium]|nr:PAS domain S-box protein [Acidobacteriota bacterium]
MSPLRGRALKEILIGVLDTTDDAIVSIDESERIVFFNAGAERLFGYSAKEVIGEPLELLLPPRCRALHHHHIEEFAKSPVASHRMEDRQGIAAVRRDGTECPVEASITKIRVGEAYLFTAVVRDISARERAAEALVTKTRQLETASNAMAAFLARGSWQEASAVLVRGALDLTQSEYGFAGVVVEGPVLRILAHHGIVWDTTENRDFYERALRTYSEQGYLEFSNLNNLFGLVITSKEAVLSNDAACDPRAGGLPPGHPALRQFLGVPILSERNVVGMIGVANRRGGYTSTEQAALTMLGQMAGVLCDSYRRHQRETSLQEQLRQSQKMEALGRLAGGIAHDFNNLLTVVLGYCEDLLRNVHAADPIYGDLQQIRQAGARAAALISQLLAFSRRQVHRRRRLDLNAVVTGAGAMVHRMIGEDIELRIQLETNIVPITADPNLLDQVILNLAVNARDAMPDGGRLTIEVRNVEVAVEDPLHPPECRPGQYVLLRVSDTGHGMDAETKARVFEPFFTTKERGKGTGLGLSMVYGVVHESGGVIAVDSAVGRGATFRIYFPTSEGSVEPLDRQQDNPAKMAGSEVILVVEDEPQVLALVARTLGRYGYTVLEASSPEEALRIGRERPEVIDLIVSDVIMPRMNGPELVRRLTTFQPHASVCFMSGHTHSNAVYHDVVKTGAVFVEKPFSPEVLVTTLRRVLDQRKSRRVE